MTEYDLAKIEGNGIELSVEVESTLNAIIDKKGREVKVFDVRELTPFVDYHILCSVGSATQAKVLMESVVDNIKGAGGKIRTVEGDPGSGWVLIDGWDLVVHIFRPELRQYYNLEGLWADLPSLDVISGENEE